MMKGNSGLMSQFRGDLVFLFWAGGLAVVLGLVSNMARVHPLPLRYQSPGERLAESVSETAVSPLHGKIVPIADRDNVVSALTNGRALFVDARGKEFFEIGRIPRARSLPREAFQEAFPSFRAEVDRTRRIVVYCSDSQCPDSTEVAEALLRLGYEDVSVFQGGWEEWGAEGLPQEP